MNFNRTTIIDNLRSIKRRLMFLKCYPSFRRLAKEKKYQLENFELSKSSFNEKYMQLKQHDISQLTTNCWQEYNEKFEKVFLPEPPFLFLRNSMILKTMFVSAGGKWLESELLFLEKTFDRKILKKLLEEDFIGGPIIQNNKYQTSHNSIHQLYHLGRFLSSTKCDLAQITSVIDWGGGYGNLAKIFKRLKSNNLTYTIIDTPMFSCLQWLYLSSVFGAENVHFISNQTDSLRKGLINILPLCYLSNREISADLFLSTWAISESSTQSQNYVIRTNWFNAPHLLIGYQQQNKKITDTGKIGELASTIGARKEPMKFLPGNYYLFR